MHVAMYYNNQDVRLEELPVPRLGPGELLIRTRASGICGSDLMEWYRIQKAPLVLGHEVTGEVVQAGEGVEDFCVGDRVFSSHHVPCGNCRYCLAGHQSVCDLLRTTHFDPGGFAEYIRVPKINVELGTLRIPDSMTFDGRLADLVIVCVGAMPAIQQAVQSIDRGGTLLFFATTAAGVDVPIPLFDFWRDEISLVTSYAGTGEDLAESLALIRDHQVAVAKMVTHRLPLADAGLGFRLATSGQDAIKVIIDPVLESI